MRGSEQTSSEFFEAQGKFKRHEEGREQAKFYKHFLEQFKSKIIDTVKKNEFATIDPEQKDTVENDDELLRLPAGSFEGCDIESLQRYINESSEAATKQTNIDENVQISAETLANMPFIELLDYIEKLEGELIS